MHHVKKDGGGGEGFEHLHANGYFQGPHRGYVRKKTFASTHAEWGVETRETVDVQLQRGKRMHNIINQRLEKKIRTPIIVLFARAAEPLAPPENGTPEPFAVPPEVVF
jgi:hypothetical protein